MSSPQQRCSQGQQCLPARLFRSPACTVRMDDHLFFIEYSQKASDLGTAAHLGGAEELRILSPKGHFQGVLLGRRRATWGWGLSCPRAQGQGPAPKS